MHGALSGNVLLMLMIFLSGFRQRYGLKRRMQFQVGTPEVPLFAIATVPAFCWSIGCDQRSAETIPGRAVSCSATFVSGRRRAGQLFDGSETTRYE